MAARHIHFLYLKITLGPTYIGQWRMAHCLSYLENLGFCVMGFYNFGFNAQKEVIQLDVLCV